jgi:hypothetical protein
MFPHPNPSFFHLCHTYRMPCPSHSPSIRFQQYSVRRVRHENSGPSSSRHSSNLIRSEFFLNVIFRRSWQNSCEKCLLALSCLTVRLPASVEPVSGFREIFNWGFY